MTEVTETMRIFGLDPGPTRSAIAGVSDLGAVLSDSAHILPNEEMLGFLWRIRPGERTRACPALPSVVLVIEMIASYGMPVGAEVFETCVWIGRFMQEARRAGLAVERLRRLDVKMHLCSSPRAKDSNVRQALIDRYGPGKAAAIGVKKALGPLYGFKSDLWAALGVAVTWADRKRREQ